MKNLEQKIIGLLVFVFIMSITLSAQNSQIKRCGVKKNIIEYKFKDDDGIMKNYDIIKIPVHFIIVHKSSEAIGEGRNLSDEQIISQIDVLNEDFRKLNPSNIETPAEFISVAADCEIEFCMAKIGPNGFRLNDVYPNPFNSSTMISYTLPKDQSVIIRLLDIRGRVLRVTPLGKQKAGSHLFKLNGKELPSGSYIAQVEIGGSSLTQKISLIK